AYEKESGFAKMSGQWYEVKLAALVFLRSVNQRVDFHIASNMKAGGKFDDIVLKVGDKTIFVQLKHREGIHSTVTERLLNAEGGDFSISKYYKSYCDLREQWGKHKDLKDCGLFEDAWFVVYTSGNMADGLDRDIGNTELHNFLNTEGKCIAFSQATFPSLQNSPEFSQFISQLRFFTEQFTEKNLDSIIQQELKTALGTDSQYDIFLGYMKNWWECSNIYLTDKIKFWSEIVKNSVADISKSKLDQLSKLDIKFDDKEVESFKAMLPDIGGLFCMCNDLTCLKVSQTIENKILIDCNTLQDRREEVLALWGRWPDCNILVVDGWAESLTEFLLVTFDLKATAKIVVNLLTENFEFSVGDELVKRNECYIPRIFLRKEHISKEIFSANETDYLVVSGMSQQDLQQLVPPGKCVEKLDVTNNSETSECHCYAIEGNEEFIRATNMFCAVHWLHKETNGFVWKQSKGDVTFLRSYLTNKISSRNLEEVMHLPPQVLLLLAKPGMGKSTELVNLAQDLKLSDPACWVVNVVLNNHTDYLKEQKLSAVELLLRAGKFKTEFEKSLFKHELEHGGNIVILMDGFDEISPDYEQKVIEMLRELSCTKYKKLYITSRPMMRETLERELFSLSFKLKPFTREDQEDFLLKFWKGIDVGPHCLRTFIAQLLDLTGKSLNDKLGTLTGVPLQTLMLAEVFQNEACQYCQSGEISLPLKLDVLQLYNRFMDRKWEIYMREKLSGNLTNVGLCWDYEQLKEMFEESHMACAMHSLLESEELSQLRNSQKIISQAKRFLDRFKRGIEKKGIVSEIVNSKAVYIHRTFAEFFAAKWFALNFNLERKYLKQKLLDQKFKVIRNFFDRILVQPFQLHKAVLNEDKDFVFSLLESPACDVNEKDDGGRTPLHIAVINYMDDNDDYGSQKHGNIPSRSEHEIMEKLLDHGADPSVEDEVLSWRPLQLADRTSAWPALELLLGKSADNNDLAHTKQMINNERFLQRVLPLAASQGYVNLITFMLISGVNVGHSINGDELGQHYFSATMLHIAAGSGQTKLMELLLNHHAEIEGRDGLGGTALTWAASQGHVETVRILIEQGADIDKCDHNNHSPILKAAEAGYTDVVKLLIEKGANVRACNKNNDTPILKAVQGGHMEIVRLLIEKDAEFNARNYNGNSPILAAAEGGYLEIVRLLVDRGANFNACNKNGNSPLLVAAKGGYLNIVRLLIHKGADFNACNKNGDNPILAASEGGYLEIVRLLVETGADLNVKDYLNRTALLKASEHGHIEIVQLLLERDVIVDVRDKYESTPILRATERRHVEIVKLLRDKGANINIYNFTGKSPLLESAENGSVEIANLLIEGGADINGSDYQRNTPILKASQRGHEKIVRLLIEKDVNVNAFGDNGNTPILEAADHCYMEIMKLLIDKGANVNSRNEDGSTPMLKTAERGDVGIVKILIETGADINVHDKNGNTPILEAAKRGHVEVVRELIQRDVKIDVCRKNGNTPLLRAAQRGHVEVVKVLIEGGANINARNKNGYTPLHEEVRNSHTEIVRMLIKKGADVNANIKRGTTPLLEAINRGDWKIVKLLIEGGADVNACCKNGNAPILEAVRFGNVGNVKLLLDQGANINIRDKYGNTPILEAVKCGHVGIVKFLTEKFPMLSLNDLLLEAIKRGHLEIVRELIEKGASVKACFTKVNSPMQEAIKYGHAEIVSLLIDNGSDVNENVKKGNTPIQEAVKRGNTEIVRSLIKKGADVTARYKNGSFLIVKAAGFGYKEIVKLLVEGGANVNARDKFGNTPLLEAAKYGDMEIVTYLLDRGANIKAVNRSGNDAIDEASLNGRIDVMNFLIERSANVN
ncbi:hypothetical protein ANN_04867, partial [Periplaneta americana]